MIYVISTRQDTYGILSYKHDNSVDYSLFFEGISLAGLKGELNYEVNKKSDIPKLSKLHLIKSTGPTLVSDRLKIIIEGVAKKEVEFFDVSITFDGKAISGFSAINLTHCVECMDIAACEYRITNFDPREPEYMFYYMLLRDEFPEDLNIAACKEHLSLIVINDEIKDSCAKAGLTGLKFSRSIDITPNNRSVCEEI